MLLRSGLQLEVEMEMNDAERTHTPPTPEALAQLELALRSLLRGEHSSLVLAFNDGPGPNYQIVGEYLEDRPDLQWVSPEERHRAVETNSLWELQWYPRIPIGSYTVAASSLPVLLRYVFEEARHDRLV